MAKKIYIGVDDKAKQVKKAYIGIDGVAKKIKKAYIGVDSVARLCFSGATRTFQTFNVTGAGFNRGGSRTVTETKNLTLDHTPIGEVFFRYDINAILEELLDISIIPDHDNVVKVTLKIKAEESWLHQYSYDLTIRIQYDYEE